MRCVCQPARAPPSHVGQCIGVARHPPPDDADCVRYFYTNISGSAGHRARSFCCAFLPNARTQANYIAGRRYCISAVMFVARKRRIARTREKVTAISDTHFSIATSLFHGRSFFDLDTHLNVRVYAHSNGRSGAGRGMNRSQP